MNDVLLSVDGVNVYTLSAFVFLAFFWSSFVLYKKAIEYHESEEEVFDTILLMGLLSFVFARLWFVMTRMDWFFGHWIRVFFVREYPGMNGWGVFLGVLIGILIMIKGLKKKFFDWLDLTSLGLSAGIPIVYVAKGLLYSGEVFIWGMNTVTIKGLLLAGWFVLLWWAEAEYRTFDWYRFRKTQARTGFVTGMFYAGLGVINLLVDWWSRTNSKWYINVILVVVGTLVVYIRSERKVRKDLKLIVRYIKKLSISKTLLKWPRIIRK